MRSKSCSPTEGSGVRSKSPSLTEGVRSGAVLRLSPCCCKGRGGRAGCLGRARTPPPLSTAHGLGLLRCGAPAASLPAWAGGGGPLGSTGSSCTSRRAGGGGATYAQADSPHPLDSLNPLLPHCRTCPSVGSVGGSGSHNRLAYSLSLYGTPPAPGFVDQSSGLGM